MGKSCAEQLKKARYHQLYVLIPDVNSAIVKGAHYTSIKFEKNISEFDACKLTEDYIEGFDAPFVKESNVKIGMSLREIVEMGCTESKLIIGEIENILFEKHFLDNDFSLNLEKTNSISVCGLNHYYENKKNISLAYARPENILEIKNFK